MKTKFSKDDLKFEKVTKRKGWADRKRHEKNLHKYIDWCLKVLAETQPRQRLDTERYTICGMYTSKANADWLSHYVQYDGYYDWLTYGVGVDETLTDGELRIDEWFEDQL